MFPSKMMLIYGLAFCLIVALDSSLVEAGPPRTAFQKETFDKVLGFLRYYRGCCQGEQGKERVLNKFTELATRYCQDEKNKQNYELTLYQRVVYEDIVQLYRGEVGNQYEPLRQFKEGLTRTAKQYCEDENRDDGEDSSEGSGTGSHEDSKGDIEAYSGGHFKKPLIITIHYLIKRVKSEYGTKPMEIRDYTDAFALDAQKLSVKELSEYVSKKKVERWNSVQKADLQETYVFHDHQNEVPLLYIGGRTKPIYAKKQTRSGANYDIRDWTKSAHIHIYNYNPLDEGTKKLVVKQTERVVYFIFPAVKDKKRVIGINEMEFSLTLSVGGLLRTLSDDEFKYQKCHHFRNNLDLSTVYYENGDVFFRKGEESISMGDILAKGPYKHQNPLLLYNFNPKEQISYN